MPVIEICLSCKQGFCSECQVCICCNPDRQTGSAEPIAFSDFLEETQPTVRINKQDEDVKDPKSTGRKRAAILYPLDLEAACEWQGLKQAGGGKLPIIGCISGLQRTRHHGPNKDTLHNEKGNVSRICYECHNRWHAQNDASYDWDNPDTTPIDFTTKATIEEMEESNKYWSRNKPKVRGPNSD